MDPVVSAQNKNFSGNGKELAKVLGARYETKSHLHRQIPRVGKSCEDFSWNHCTSTPHRSETNGIAERAVRRIKEGTSAVLLFSGLDEKWWAVSMECYCYLRNIQDLLSDGKTPYARRFGVPLKGPVIPFGAMVEYHPVSCKRPVATASVRPSSLTRKIPRLCIIRERNLEWRHFGRRL